MPVKTRRKENSAKTKGPLPNDVPQFFRLNIEVGDLKANYSLSYLLPTCVPKRRRA